MTRLREYLDEIGYDGLPADPRGMKGYRSWLEDRHYAPNSVSACLAPVRLIYSTLLGVDTAKIIRSPKRAQGFLKDPVSEEDTAKLLRFVSEKACIKDRAMVYLMVYLGLRDVEVSRLDIGDFYKEDDLYFLRLWRKAHSGKDVRKEVSGDLLTVLMAYLATVSGRTVGEAMFQGQRGRIHPVTVGTTVSRIMQACGVKNADNTHRITPHSLRHTAITMYMKATGDIRGAQRFADHTDPRTTEIYAHDVGIRPETVLAKLLQR
jgi:integrase